MQYFQKFGLAELEFAGVGLIMSDVAIEFKNEIFYGERIIASVTAGEFSKAMFDIYYKLEKETSQQTRILVAVAKTAMVCYDYSLKKIVAIPAEALNKLGMDNTQ